MTRRAKGPEIPKYQPCGRCMGGLLRVRHVGLGGVELFKMVECECLKRWRAARNLALNSAMAAGRPAKAAPVPVDGKAMAANG